jgi:hypothetical protein
MMGGEDKAYNFMSGGPEAGDSYPDTADGDLTEEEVIDESTEENKKVILEMFKRMSNF